MSASGRAERVCASPETLCVAWPDGSVDEFASVWLCDNAPAHRDPHSGQRLIDIADLPAQPRIRSAGVRDGKIRIEWDGALEETSVRSAGGSRRSAAHAPNVRNWRRGAGSRARTSRPRATSRVRPCATWLGIAATRSRWLTRLLQDGIAFLSAVPASDGALIEAVQLVGRVAETNYGLVFDVRSVAQPENLAYSDLGLGLHTDNPYRDPVPGFQALHVLIASTDGGESVFADGFALAEHLRTTDPEGFALLSRTPVPFHYRSKNAELFAERPLIELTCRGEVAAVHYNSRSIAPLRLAASEAVPFYTAYRRFAALLRDTRLQLKLRLAEGEIVVFDNQRILHGRTAFASARHARHLRGCYLTRDSVYSNTAILRRELCEGTT